MATTLTPQGIEGIFSTEILSIFNTEYMNYPVSVLKVELLILLGFVFLYCRLYYSVIKIEISVLKKEPLYYIGLLILFYILYTEYINI